VQLPRKRPTDSPNSLLRCRLAQPVRRSNMVGWLADPATKTFPITARTYSWCAFRSSACLAWPPRIHWPLSRQDPPRSVSSFGLWNRGHGLPAVARANPCWCAAGGEWLASRRADLSAVENNCLPPCAGRGHRHGTKVRDGRDLDTPSRSLVPGTAPALRFPDEPNGSSRRFSIRQSPAEPPAPQLDPQTCCHPLPVPVSKSERPTQASALSVVHSGRKLADKKGAEAPDEMVVLVLEAEGDRGLES